MKLIRTIETCELIVLEKYMKSEGEYKDELAEVLNNLRYIKYETGLEELDEMLEEENEPN